MTYPAPPLTAHALARLLLEGPDLPVFTACESRENPVCEVHVVTHETRPLTNAARSIVLGYEDVPVEPHIIIGELDA